jgi:hypothetical protein
MVRKQVKNILMSFLKITNSDVTTSSSSLPTSSKVSSPLLLEQLDVVWLYAIVAEAMAAYY